MAEEIGALRAALALESAAFDRGVQSARRQLAGLEDGMQRAGGKVVKFGDQLTREGATALRTLGRASQSGVSGLQNLGFQVQDFAVQVGAGTSASQALAQQLPQLLSGFGLLGIAIGTASAVLIPVAKGFFGAGDQARSASEAVADFGKNLDLYQGFALTAATSTAELTEKFGEFAGQVRGFSEYLAGVAIGQTLDGLLETVTALNAPLQEVQDRFVTLAETKAQLARISNEDAYGLFTAREAVAAAQDSLDAAGAALGLTADQALVLKSAIDEVGRAEGVANIAAAASEALDVMRQLVPEGQQLPDPLREAAFALGKMAERAAEVATETGGVTDSVAALNVGLVAAYGLYGDLRRQAAALAAENRAAAEAALAAMQVEFSPGGQALGRYGSRAPGGTSAQNDLARRNAAALTEVSSAASSAARSMATARGEAEGLASELDDVDEKAQTLAEAMQGQLASAVDGLGDAFGNFVTDGFDNFKDFADGIVSVFKRAIAQMISTAVANPIKIALGLPGLGGGAGGGLGGLGGIIGGLGKVAAPLLAVSAAISFFRKKVTELDSGLRITADSAGTLVEEFRTIETKRFWGLSKKVRTDVNAAGSDMADPIIAAVSGIREQSLALAATIGLGEDAFASFAYNVSLSLKGLSAEQAQAAIQAELAKIGDAFANAALGWYEVTEGVLLEGESWTQALERLSGALTTVNATMAYLDKALFDVTVAGAKAASELVNLFGGLDQFNAAQSAYLELFYSDQEKLSLALADLSKTFAGLGVTVPESNAAFRKLVESQDLTTTAGREMYAALLKLAPTFDQVKKMAAEMATEVAGPDLVAKARADLARAIGAEQDALKLRLDAAQDALRETQGVVDALRRALRGMRQEGQALASRRAAQSVIAGALAGGRIADTDAFRNALDVLAEPSEGLFSNFEDYQRDFLLTANTISALEGKAGAQLSADEQMVDGINRQIEILEQLALSFAEQTEAILSVADAVKALQSLGVTPRAPGTGGGALGVVESAYVNMLGRAGDAAGIAFWQGMLSSGAVSEANFLSEFRKGAVANNEIPRFASGGVHMGGWRIVGENGPEAEFTPPSRIVSAGQTRSIMGGEIQEMKEELKAYMREVVRNTGATARTLDKFDRDGMPPERAA